MSRKVQKRHEMTDYFLFPEEGFPQVINWKIIAGNRRLSILEETDLVFDNYDLKLRRMDVEINREESDKRNSPEIP